MKNLISVFVIVIVAVAFVNCQNKKIGDSFSSNALQSVYFDYDKAHIRDDAAVSMQSNAAYLKNNQSVSVTVEGNCDNRGTNEYNLALGQRRAEAARDYLTNLGVASSRMNTVSYGEEKPVCGEGNESCWQRNRRADFRR
ncbi:MAG: peptidoglycan-associated lipoprotein Pal [Deltaproteobacteria bacterium]|nr:peptidoglycan-associated lipoprotein Pal [Deltaproteobacteria bacterium]